MGLIVTEETNRQRDRQRTKGSKVLRGVAGSGVGWVLGVDCDDEWCWVVLGGDGC